MRILLVLSLFAASAFAQETPSTVHAQHMAMTKLSFLEGNWSGPATVSHGPGNVIHLTQSERVQSRLDGLLLTIEGAGAEEDGRIVFRAFATISYDDGTHQYRIRAYNNGHYVDSELSVEVNGFSWSYSAGPAHIVNTMHLSSTGEWEEKTESTTGQNPPMTVVEMKLKKHQ